MEISCIPGALQYKTIVYYSHLVPVAIAILLSAFVLIKSNFSHLSRIFTFFVLVFCLWLIGDTVAWLAPSYHMVSFTWAFLDYLNILFYLLAVYFFLALTKGSDIEDWQKVGMFLLTVPAWWLTVSGQSIVDFYQPWCEATNNSILTYYKFAVEILSIGIIMLVATHALLLGRNKARRKQIGIVALALTLFLTIFASTEYIASQTGEYETHLYSLFVLPVFLAMIIYSITNLKVFAFRSFGTQLLVGVLLIMVGSQFFFLQNTTDQTLTLVTFGLSIFLAVTLLRNVKREEEARAKIEGLARELQIANEGQSTLIHFMNHQIKGYLNKAHIVFTELLTGKEYQPISQSANEMLVVGETTLKEGVDFVQQVLKASDIEKGTFVYNMEALDLAEVVQEVSDEKRKQAEDKGLKYELDIEEGDYNTKGDCAQLKEAVKNLVGNAVAYTSSGSINVTLSREGNNIKLAVQDTGVGLSDEVKPKLFTKGGRSKDSQKINVNSTGYGLSIVKGIAQAHKGRVWAESEGEGKGSTFCMELPVGK